MCTPIEKMCAPIEKKGICISNLLGRCYCDSKPGLHGTVDWKWIQCGSWLSIDCYDGDVICTDQKCQYLVDDALVVLECLRSGRRHKKGYKSRRWRDIQLQYAPNWSHRTTRAAPCDLRRERNICKYKWRSKVNSVLHSQSTSLPNQRIWVRELFQCQLKPNHGFDARVATINWRPISHRLVHFWNEQGYLSLSVTIQMYHTNAPTLVVSKVVSLHPLFGEDWWYSIHQSHWHQTTNYCVVTSLSTTPTHIYNRRKLHF